MIPGVFMITNGIKLCIQTRPHIRWFGMHFVQFMHFVERNTLNCEPVLSHCFHVHEGVALHSATVSLWSKETALDDCHPKGVRATKAHLSKNHAPG